MKFTQGGLNIRFAVHTGSSRSVVKWIAVHDRPVDALIRSASLVRHLSNHGWPFPTIHEVADLGEFTVTREEFVPGHHPSELTASTVIALIGLPATSPVVPSEDADWSGQLLANLQGADPKIRPAALEGSAFGRRTLDEATQAVAAADFHDRRYAVIHNDFSPGNILVSADGSMVAVVDWEGVTVGDPAFDLATLEWDLELYGRAAGHLLPALRDQLGETTSASTRHAYRLYLACRNLSWSMGTTDEPQITATTRHLLALS